MLLTCDKFLSFNNSKVKLMKLLGKHKLKELMAAKESLYVIKIHVDLFIQNFCSDFLGLSLTSKMKTSS